MNKLVGTATSNYLFWTITSFYLQARDKPAESSLPLQLAEKMSKRAIEEKKLTTYEGAAPISLSSFSLHLFLRSNWLYWVLVEFQLLLLILEEQGKHEEALKEIAGEIGQRFYKVEYDRRRRELDYLVVLKKWKDVHSLSRELIEQMWVF